MQRSYNARMHFPIAELLPSIRESLATHPRLVLEAPPGAGKTTQVPLALLDAEWLQGRKIVMLEPRRVAARAAAGFMAQQLGESVGDTVGYRIRFENKVSAQTRIEVVTEGILTRMLQDDPSLDGIGYLLLQLETPLETVTAFARAARDSGIKVLLNADYHEIEGTIPHAEVIFTGPAGRLEGRYQPAKQKGSPIGIVLHPHPQFGGTMNNQIVYRLFYMFQERGFTCLRFNFRGVGRSQGSFDHGEGELSDAASALDDDVGRRAATSNDVVPGGAMSRSIRGEKSR